MDVSPDHEPTLIERGTDVHLNHPLTAHRGVHGSQPARGKHGSPHPSSLRKGDEGRNTKSRAAPDRPYLGQGSGAPRIVTTPSEYITRLKGPVEGHPPE